MAVSSYDVGSLIVVSAAFTVNGVATDPTTVTCKVADPLGVVTQPTVVKDSVGNYHANVDTTNGHSGLWSYRFTGVGACQAVEENQFYVEVPAF